MANEYAVNQADLKAVADAIRNKGGTSDALTFPGGFVDAVDAIQTGGGGDDALLLSIVERTITNLDTDRFTYVGRNAFYGSDLEMVNLPNLESCGPGAFSACSALRRVVCPKLTAVPDTMFHQSRALVEFDLSNILTVGKQSFFATDLKEIVLPKCISIGQNAFSSNNNAQIVDLGENFTGSYASNFPGSPVLKTLVFRRNTVVSLYNVSNLNSTPFASGGTGGTIYIPKALYDELGTGSDLDYKANTNWAAIDAYGTITWAQIEGSEYE